MKRIALFIALIVLFCSCKQKEQEIVIVPDIEKNHLQRNHLFGQIKEIATQSFLLVQDSLKKNIPGDLISTMVQHYSTDGYLTSIIKISADGDTLSTEKISYTNNAQELSHEIFNGEGQLLMKTEFKYDRFGFKSKETCYLKDSVLYTINYKTDDKGNAIEMSEKNIYQASTTSRIFYNKVGLVAKIEELEPSGKLFKYVTIEYDNYGDEVNRRVFKAGDELIEYTYTEYDQQGRLLKVIYEDRLHQMREVSTFSKHDNKGNWTYEENLKNNQPVNCRKRDITYY